MKDGWTSRPESPVDQLLSFSSPKDATIAARLTLLNHSCASALLPVTMTGAYYILHGDEIGVVYKGLNPFYITCYQIFGISHRRTLFKYNRLNFWKYDHVRDTAGAPPEEETSVLDFDPTGSSMILEEAKPSS